MERSDYMKKRIISIFVLLVIVLSAFYSNVYGAWYDYLSASAGVLGTASINLGKEGLKLLENLTDVDVEEDRDEATENDYLCLEESYNNFLTFMNCEKRGGETIQRLADANNYSRNQLDLLYFHLGKAERLLELKKNDKQRIYEITHFSIDNDEDLEHLRTCLELYGKFLAGIEDCTYNKDNGQVNITSSFELKLSYNVEQIQKYKEKYSVQDIAINLTGNQLEAVREAWRIKLATQYYDYEKFFSDTFKKSKNIHISKSDDGLIDKMNYDLDEIKLYLGVYGKDIGLTTNGNEGVLIEWEYMLQHGEHSDYYKEHATNDKLVHRNHEKDITSDHGHLWDDGCVKYGVNEAYYGDTSKREYDQKEKNGTLLIDQYIEKIPKLDYEDFIDIPLSPEVKEHLEKQAKQDDEDKKENGIKYTIPYADGTAKETNVDTIITSGEDFLNNVTEDKIHADNLQNLSNSIYNILLIVGVIIAVLIGAIIGIKFMVGSVEEKADVKKLLVPYIVGCVVVFGAFGIWKLVVIILSGI